MTPRHTVLIIGSGFGGQIAAINLLKRGIDDFVLLERRDFMGGTWCQNTYPGAAVDVHSPLYSISSEPYDWSQMFAGQDELEAYTNHVIDKHGLRERTITGANVVQVEWADDAWEVTTEAKGTFRGQFLINASGPLSTPVVPAFPGIDDFQGHAFHTNDWDHSYDYKGKKVAVVGSGASAAQVIPTIQPDVDELHVFQRTPHWVMPRPDRTFTPLQRAVLRRRLPYEVLRKSIYWTLEYRMIGFKYSRRLLEAVGQRKALNHLRKQVTDPELQRKLTPDFTIGCKRVILSSTYYPAIAAENTTLHDRTDGIDHLDETGIVTASGEHIDLDLVVWSTGYDATDGVISYPVIGRDGTKIGSYWDPFPRAYLGTTIPGFPNLFIVTGPNTGIGHTSALFIIESQMKYILKAIEETRSAGAASIEVTARAEGDYTAMIHREMERTVWKTGGCHSWYQSKSGHVIAMFPGFSFTYRRLASRFRREDHVIA